MPSLRAKDGCSLYYESHGAGRPVVLIPGLGGDGRFWNGVVQRLGPDFRAIVVDHRGAGRSDRPPGPYTIARIAADVLEILDAEGVERADLIGHSTGGAVVQTLALDAPGRAGKLVISASWCQPDARFRTVFNARLALLEANQPKIYQALTHAFGYGPEWLAAHEDELSAAVERAPEALAPLEIGAARLRMLLAFDRASDIGRIDKPSLVLASEGDILLPPAYSREIAAAIPGAELALCHGGHFYPREQPEEFARLVSRFLNA